jgi:hypothetical protein
MNTKIAIALAAALSLAACGGGGGSVTPSAPTGGGGNFSNGGSGNLSNAAGYAQNAITITNTFGSPLGSYSAYERTQNVPSATLKSNALVRFGAGGCNNGVEYLVPDSNGDPDSTETKIFYDAACTQIARDVVRVWSSATAPAGMNAESLRTTEQQYTQNGSILVASRLDDSYVTSPGSFTTNGYPSLLMGSYSNRTGTLKVGTTRLIISNAETIVSPAGTPGVDDICSDSTGYNTVGILDPASLKQNSFGWQGVANGTRTQNGSGSVTYQVTHVSQAYYGTNISGLGILTGTANAACPISTPLYTLTPSPNQGTDTIPVTATYTNGVLTALSISNATLSNGAALSVSATGSPLQINGTETMGGSTFATFTVDAFGDGSLTLSTGNQFAITDWHVNSSVKTPQL